MKWQHLRQHSRKDVLEQHSNNFQGQWDIVTSQMVDIFKCQTSHPIRPATALSFGQLKKGKNHQFHNTFGNKNILINTLLASNLLRIFNYICQWYGTENLVQRSIRICMSFGHRSANSVTTTKKCEVSQGIEQYARQI